MKLEFHAGKFGGNITLIPETIKDSTELARLVMNAKRNPLYIGLSFKEDGTQEANIHMEKINENKQDNFITNIRRKK